MRILVLFTGFILVFGLTFPAFAVSKRELEAKVFQLEQRLMTLERRILTGDPAAERLMQRMDALESSQRSMTGEVERLRYENNILQEQVQSLAMQIVDLQSMSARVQRHLEAVDIVSQNPDASQMGAGVYSGRRSGGVYAGGSSRPAPPVIVEEDKDLALAGLAGPDDKITRRELVNQGLDKMNEGDFLGAQTAFARYLYLNPTARDKGDVLFWLAETYYAKSGFSKAAENYIASMRAAPKGDYAPEAMVKLAATARSLGKLDMACQTLASFPAQYPQAVRAVREKARIEKFRSGC
ncbi:MAG: hypothetical protein COA91_03215 [Robiginitomaculum sp.]|nr:MAG: hypothetical protein COA91_03215 [Robiginitomaculum sp.]